MRLGKHHLTRRELLTAGVSAFVTALLAGWNAWETSYGNGSHAQLLLISLAVPFAAFAVNVLVPAATYYFRAQRLILPVGVVMPLVTIAVMEVQFAREVLHSEYDEGLMMRVIGYPFFVVLGWLLWAITTLAAFAGARLSGRWLRASGVVLAFAVLAALGYYAMSRPA